MLLVLLLEPGNLIAALPADASLANETALGVSVDVPGYLARVEKNNPEEVEQALRKAEQYYLDNDMNPASPVIAFVLHGPEVEIFFRENYRRYKPIVDLAARLSALNVIDIKICRTRLRHLDTREESLFPFVGDVPFGPAEIERLTGEEGFVYF
ncbi:MAG TPA: acyl-CoA transferase [Porticoccaceae bacterium]|nr:acyl-CoA transferase [Porticoccaceae bacterium]HCO61271.1 acyl-CoA transferase [Porticoccaceae bacterium]